MESSANQEGMKRPHWTRWVAVASALILLATGGIIVLRDYRTAERYEKFWKTMPSADWKEVSTVLDAAIKSARYRDAAACPRDLSRYKTTNFRQIDDFRYRSIIDFMRSLKHAQVESLQKGPLGFSMLTRDQQNTLLGLAIVHDEKPLLNKLKESRVFINGISKDDLSQGFQFSWLVQLDSDSCGGTMVVFLSDGRMIFLSDQIAPPPHQRSIYPRAT